MNIFEKTKDHKKHFTVTGYTVNPARTKMLLIHHKKLNKWLPAGGHLEENEVPHEAAIREVFEETGVRAEPIIEEEHDLHLKNEIDTQIPRPYALMYQIIPLSKKDIEHIHLDMVFALQANDLDEISIEHREVHDVQWRSKDEIIDNDDVFDSVKGFAQAFLRSE